jgi:hypothetical protein
METKNNREGRRSLNASPTKISNTEPHTNGPAEHISKQKRTLVLRIIYFLFI